MPEPRRPCALVHTRWGPLVDLFGWHLHVHISLDVSLLDHRRCCFLKRPHFLPFFRIGTISSNPMEQWRPVSNTCFLTSCFTYSCFQLFYLFILHFSLLLSLTHSPRAPYLWLTDTSLDSSLISDSFSSDPWPIISLTYAYIRSPSLGSSSLVWP